jgi:formylglycine-generating enzyme required for sulfatase activity
VGCHERRNSTPPSRNTLAAARRPSAIEPWYGPIRGFSFQREVQPVLDEYCVGCHNGQPREDGREIPNLRGDQEKFVVYRSGNPEAITTSNVSKPELVGKYPAIFEPSYLALRRMVRVGGLESDLHLLPPLEFGANTTELVQMLSKGHHGVILDAEAWDRLITWIDLNAPCQGTWSEFVPISGDQTERRLMLRRLYGGVVEDAEEVVETSGQPIAPVIPDPPEEPPVELVRIDNWPFDRTEAGQRQAAEGPATRRVDLGRGVTLELIKIPAGQFVMGDPHGERDERPLAAVRIERPFWMARCEITNRQYACFDPQHDSRFEHRTSWIFSEDYLGWQLNRPQQPVVRVSWNRAIEFCRWLSERTGIDFTLPTEAQWEYACRAGTDSPFSFGDGDADFSKAANLADRTIRELAYQGWRPRSPDLVPRDPRFDDGALVTAEVGRYRPNPWGLCDMHGNVAEWTRTSYHSYPYRPDDGRDDLAAGGEKVVRGGSWYDRPKRCRSAFRLSYPPYQRVFNVGFRVVCEAGADGAEIVLLNSRNGTR